MSNPRRPGPDGARWSGNFHLGTYRHPKAYVRVSTDEQAEEGTSIEVQIRQLRAYAAAFQVDLSDQDFYVDEGWSGKDLNRPALQRLRDDARAGRVDCVMVTKLDRFSRNLRDTVNLCLGEWQDEAPVDRRIVLKSVSEPFDTCTDFGRMVFGLLAMFAEFERKRISERTWSGKVSRAEAGRNAGHRAPYGFSLAAAPDGKASLFQVVESEAAEIRKIAALYLQGFGYDLIARRLNEEGSRFRGEHLWQSQQVARILANPLIAGTYVYGRRGSLPKAPPAAAAPFAGTPIIPPETYAALQGERAGRTGTGRRTGAAGLLAGLLRCGRCGAACGIKQSGSESYRYYRCLRRKQSGQLACSQPNVRSDLLDGLLLAAIEAVLSSVTEAMAAHLRQSLANRRAGLARLLHDLAAEEQRLRDARLRYFAWLEQGTMRPESVQERLDELAEQLAPIAARRLSLEAQLAAPPEAVPAPGWFGQAWSALAYPERRRLVGALIRSISLDGRQVRIVWSHDICQIEFAPQ